MTDEPYTEHWYAIVKAWLWLWMEKRGVDATVFAPYGRGGQVLPMLPSSRPGCQSSLGKHWNILIVA